MYLRCLHKFKLVHWICRRHSFFYAQAEHIEIQRDKHIFRLCFLSLIRFLSTKRICLCLLSEAEEYRRDAHAEMMANSMSANREQCGSQRGTIGWLAQWTDRAIGQSAQWAICMCVVFESKVGAA